MRCKDRASRSLLARRFLAPKSSYRDAGCELDSCVYLDLVSALKAHVIDGKIVVDETCWKLRGFRSQDATS
jgi:hypothetical protein